MYSFRYVYYILISCFFLKGFNFYVSRKCLFFVIVFLVVLFYRVKSILYKEKLIYNYKFKMK